MVLLARRIDMKKNIIILVIVAGILIISDFLLYQNRNIFSKKSNQDNKKSENVIDKTIMGIVYESSVSSLLLKANDGYFYNIALNENNSTELKMGSNIKITYQGTLNKTNDTQNLEIKNIENLNMATLPESWNDKGIFKDYYEQAYEKLQTLTLEEKLGQLLLVRVPEEGQTEAITEYNLGGYILFGRDTKGETKESLNTKINTYQQAAKIPLLIATDEEGGTVVRISNNPNLRSTKFLSPRETYQNGGYDGITQQANEINTLLAQLGINVNLAPVADISIDENDFIYQRSFGIDANSTAKYVETVIQASQQSKVSNVLKHFPGYGNNKDTHTGVAVDSRSLDSFRNNDLIPFQAGVKVGAEAIMVSHNIINAVDNANPASLSLSVHKLASNELGFKGILMTDDLDMDAIKDIDNSVVKALLADNDMLILSDYKSAINALKTALNDGTLTEDYLNYHVFKVLAWKFYKGLL